LANYPLNPLPLGKLTVAAPGTTIGFTANCQTFYGKTFYNTSPQGTNGPEDAWANKILIFVNPSNAGLVYIGYAGMDKSTGKGVIAALQKGNPVFELSDQEGSNKYRVGDIVVDADNANDWIIASAKIWG
jgi:hypothetical protein